MKQKNKIQLLLIAAFAGLSVMCYAQGKLCSGVGDGYKIVSLQDPSDPSSYEWLEDGKSISGAVAAEYTVPADHAEGKFTFIRRSKKDGCDWVSSNAYTVEVISCKTIGGDDSPGTKGTVQDSRDGKVYKIVKMPDGKVWMAENLNYQNGLTFNRQSDQANGVQYKDNANGVPAIGSFWCPAVSGASLSTDQNTCNVYGALYTWETAMSTDGGKDDKGGSAWSESSVLGRYNEVGKAPVQTDPTNIRGICPDEYHLPTDYEWAALLDAVDPAANPDYVLQTTSDWHGTNAPAEAGVGAGAGVKMKSASTYMGADPGNGAWVDNANRGNDAWHFAAVPAGSRDNYGAMFGSRGTGASYWSSSAGASSSAWNRQFASGSAQVNRNFGNRSRAFSVRCVRN